MEGEESPLDVLSRAATMIQEDQAFSVADESAKFSNQKQTTKWKRDRRSRLPEYSRKSDPKFPEVNIPESFNSHPNGNSGTNKVNVGQHYDNSNNLNSANASSKDILSLSDTPLDMSVKQRGLPPSYSQTINSPEYKSNYRSSVIQSVPPPSREDLPSGISMCDPIIDEHFRRSLGSDYKSLYTKNSTTKEYPSPEAPSSVMELMDSSGLSVDEHFAKALGETWAKLNNRDSKLPPNSNENNMVST